MRTSAVFQRKESCLEPQACEIEKVISLSDREFTQFREQLLRDYDFIADNAANLCVRDGVVHCLLVVGKSSEDGILVNSEGCSYARYAAYFPNAKGFLLAQEQEAVQAESVSPAVPVSPALLAFGEKMQKLVDASIRQALDGHDQSTYVISMTELRDIYDNDTVDEDLFIALLKERSEIADIEVDGGDIMVVLSQEAIIRHDQSKMRVLTQEDVIIMQAKHTLWNFDAGGEQADFSGCRLSDVSMDYLEFNGAVFRGAVFENVSLHGAGVCFGQFQGARFVGCDMSRLMAEECDFSGAVFDRCNLSGARLAHSNFSHVQFLETDLLASDMRNCCIEGANIDETQADGIDLTRVSADEQTWAQDDGMTMGGIGSM